MPTFIVHETIIKEFTVEAKDMDEAIAKAIDLPDSAPHTLHSAGLTYAMNTDSGEDRLL